MYLIVGLGNPGSKYAHTRHNVGFDVVAALAGRLGASIGKAKDHALIAECLFGGEKLILALPQTYMNLSGQAVSALARWYRVEPEHLLAVYDDIDLPQGFLRLRKNGGPGTHNGMRSLVDELGYDQFPRLRVGVGERPPGWELADWVLSRYQTREEQDAADAAYALAGDAILEYVRNGMESAMCKYNTKKQKKTQEISEGADE